MSGWVNLLVVFGVMLPLGVLVWFGVIYIVLVALGIVE